MLRLLVRMLPPGFRYDFGRAIESDVAERGQAGDRFGVWWRDLPSLASTVIREHADAARQDVKLAFRGMRRTPGFASMTVLVLALGTGVSITMFSIIDAVLLHAPFRDPGRVVAVLQAREGHTPTAGVSVDTFRALESGLGSFEAVAAFNGGGTHVTGTVGNLRRLNVECISASMFDVLGATPIIGRRFDASDDQPGASPVIVLSYRFWQRLGGSPSIVGTALAVNSTPTTVIGVMPRYFAGPLSRSDDEAWLPMRRPIAGGGLPGCPAVSGDINVYARLAPGVSIEQARGAVGSLALWPLDDYTFGEIRQQLAALGGAVACVFLIACFNVGGLQVERTLARRREMAVRVSLGASRARLVRQVLTENLVLAIAAGILGTVATWSTLEAVVALMPGHIPYLDEIEVNLRVIVAALAAASAAGVIAGVLPLFQIRHADPAHDLSASHRVSQRHGGWARRSVVIGQITLSVVVLVAAGLMIRTFVALRPTHPGFDPRNKVSTRVNLLADSPDQRRQFVATLFDELRLSQGVRRTTATTYLPLSGSAWIDRVEHAGGAARITIGHITPEFFDVMRIPLRVGRPFNIGDTGTSLPVIIVNDVLARQISADGHVLGLTIKVPLGSQRGARPVERQVVGVVASTRFMGGDLRERGTAWVPYLQDPVTFVIAVVESDGRPAMSLADGLHRVIRQLKPSMAPHDALSLQFMVDRSVSNWRFGAWLFGVFGASSLVLATIGLMTTIGWSVRQRSQELAVRLALGASAWQIVRLVGTQGLALTLAGIALGCLVAAATTRYLQDWLYAVTPLDKPTFALVAAGMLCIALLATLVPVRRATRVDPMAALKAE